MNNLDNITQMQPNLPPSSSNNPLAMSSREIAELCEKKHQHTKRDIEKMLADLDLDASKFGRIYLDAQNRRQTEYNLPKDLTVTLITGYRADLRYKVVKRLEELEGANAKSPLDFSDPQVLLGVMSHLKEQVAAKDVVIVEQGVRLKKLDRLEGAAGTMCLTDAAKTLGVQRKVLLEFMASRRWIYKRTGNKSWVGFADKLKDRYLDHDDHIYFDGQGNERVSTRALVTAKGLVKLAELLEQPLH